MTAPTPGPVPGQPPSEATQDTDFRLGDAVDALEAVDSADGVEILRRGGELHDDLRRRLSDLAGD